jgi:hypothetical protein
MEKDGKFDKWILRILGGENTKDSYPGRSDNDTYEELLMQEEVHRQALEQQLLDAKSEREFLAAEARAEAQHQREMLGITNDAIALDQQIEKNLQLMEEFRRQNPTATSMTMTSDGFTATWDPSLNSTTRKSQKEVECMQCFKKTPTAAFCSHCGQEL